MSDKPGRRDTTNFKTPAMKKWQDHLKHEDDEPANNSGEMFGFFIPTFAVFCLFMVVGTSTADDPWGEVA